MGLINVGQLKDTYHNNFDTSVKYALNSVVQYNNELYRLHSNAEIGTMPSDGNFWHCVIRPDDIIKWDLSDISDEEKRKLETACYPSDIFIENIFENKTGQHEQTYTVPANGYVSVTFSSSSSSYTQTTILSSRSPDFTLCGYQAAYGYIKSGQYQTLMILVAFGNNARFLTWDDSTKVTASRFIYAQGEI